MPRPPTITRHILGCLILIPARQDVLQEDLYLPLITRLISYLFIIVMTCLFFSLRCVLVLWTKRECFAVQITCLSFLVL